MSLKTEKEFCRDIFRKGLKADPPMTVSEWADTHRILPRESSAEPGLWRTSRTPYLKEIMDHLSPSSCEERIIFMKSSQVGATECGLNWIGFIACKSPGPALVVQPTVDVARTKFSKLRLNPSINATPVLRERMREGGEQSNTLLTKEFPGGILLLGGANSAAALRSMPIRFLFLDEVDAYPADVDGEGDPVNLAVKRTDTFPKRKIFMVSTPTVKDVSRIEKAFEESDRRRYHVPCPECGGLQWLKWGNLQFEHEDYRLKGDVVYACEHCGAVIEEHRKTLMLEKGKWIPEVEGENRPPGYHINALYSPVGWLSWPEIVQEFLDAKQKRDTQRLKVWINTVLAETWEEEGSTIDMSELYSHRSRYGPEVPQEAAILTAGVDVQMDRIELEVVAWGPGEQSWGLEYKVLLGSPTSLEVWDALDEYLSKEWKHESGLLLKLACVCIDTGGQHTQQAYEFIRPRQPRKIFGIKGSSQAGKPIVGGFSRVYNKKVKLFPVGTDMAKDQIYARLRITEPGPRYMHFPPRDVRGYDDEHFKQLTSERVVWKGGKRKYEKRYAGIRNEALDCRVYATAALELLKTFASLNLEKAAKHLKMRIEKMDQDDAGEQEPEEVILRRPGRSNWITNW